MRAFSRRAKYSFLLNLKNKNRKSQDDNLTALRYFFLITGCTILIVLQDCFFYPLHFRYPLFKISFFTIKNWINCYIYCYQLSSIKFCNFYQSQNEAKQGKTSTENHSFSLLEISIIFFLYSTGDILYFSLNTLLNVL